MQSVNQPWTDLSKDTTFWTTVGQHSPGNLELAESGFLQGISYRSLSQETSHGFGQQGTQTGKVVALKRNIWSSKPGSKNYLKCDLEPTCFYFSEHQFFELLSENNNQHTNVYWCLISVPQPTPGLNLGLTFGYALTTHAVVRTRATMTALSHCLLMEPLWRQYQQPSSISPNGQPCATPCISNQNTDRQQKTNRGTETITRQKRLEFAKKTYLQSLFFHRK